MPDASDLELADSVARVVESLAIRAGCRIDDISGSIQHVILREVVDLSGDQHLVDMLTDSVAANVKTVVNLLRYHIDTPDFEVPAIATHYARRLAQCQKPIDALVRAYRLGQTEFLRIAFDELRATETGGRISLMAAEQILATTAEYVDWVTERVIRSYWREREQWLSQRDMARARQIRRVLSGRITQTHMAERLIGFPLRLRHVAIIGWTKDADAAADGHTDLELCRLTEFLPLNGELLRVPVDEATMWAWLPLFADATTEDVVAALAAVADSSAERIFFSAGTIESGIHGFRTSHVRAQLVRNAMVAGRNGQRVGNFADAATSVTALLSNDLALARNWVAFVMGPLGNDDPETARLRETLQMFLETGASYKTAAEKLHVHPNTVKYRIHKAEERLPVRGVEGRVDLALALVLCSQLGCAVLADHGAVGTEQ
ncbi:MAG TPA: helix-turn-helix domain-containing protein [Mycobacterium sp.]|nr:helix-turn-helix domain-containing protein [Mycobacterium sp.]